MTHRIFLNGEEFDKVYIKFHPQIVKIVTNVRDTFPIHDEFILTLWSLRCYESGFVPDEYKSTKDYGFVWSDTQDGERYWYAISHGFNIRPTWS